jgi:hypothetical protein
MMMADVVPLHYLNAGVMSLSTFMMDMMSHLSYSRATHTNSYPRTTLLPTEEGQRQHNGCTSRLVHPKPLGVYEDPAGIRRLALLRYSTGRCFRCLDILIVARFNRWKGGTSI